MGDHVFDSPVAFNFEMIDQIYVYGMSLIF